MLPKEHRLKKETEIKRLFSKGKGVYDLVCGLKYVQNKSDISRFVVVVGTKVSKKAVVRNKLRRQVKEILKKNLNSIKPGFDVAMMVREEALKADFETLKSHVERSLKKAGLL